MISPSGTRTQFRCNCSRSSMRWITKEQIKNDSDNERLMCLELKMPKHKYDATAFFPYSATFDSYIQWFILCFILAPTTTREQDFLTKAGRRNRVASWLHQKWGPVIESSSGDAKKLLDAERNYQPWAYRAGTARAAEEDALCDCKVWEIVLESQNRGRQICHCDTVLPVDNLWTLLHHDQVFLNPWSCVERVPLPYHGFRRSEFTLIVFRQTVAIMLSWQFRS